MSFNLKNYLLSLAEKKKDAIPTESSLRGGKDSKDPTEIFEKQLEPRHKEEEVQPIEKKLEKGRKAAETEVKLTEGRLNSSKSKLAVHRNPEAFEGNVPKLEEKRLANKPVEKEKYEAASTTDKKKMWPVMTGKDGIRTASLDFNITWTKKAAYDDDFDMPGERSILDVAGPVEMIDPDLNDLIEEVGEDVTKSRAWRSEYDPQEDVDVDDEEDEDEKFSASDVKAIDLGDSGTPVHQYIFDFDPGAFRNEKTARTEALSFLSEYFRIPKTTVEQMMIINYNRGKLSINIEEKNTEPEVSASPLGGGQFAEQHLEPTPRG